MRKFCNRWGLGIENYPNSMKVMRQNSSQNAEGSYIQVGTLGYNCEGKNGEEDEEKLTKIFNHIMSFNGRTDCENPYQSDEKGEYGCLYYIFAEFKIFMYVYFYIYNYLYINRSF